MIVMVVLKRFCMVYNVIFLIEVDCKKLLVKCSSYYSPLIDFYSFL